MPVTRTWFFVAISNLCFLTSKQEYVKLQNGIKIVRTSKLFVFNNFFFRYSLFQSQSWLWELTAAIFRESAGYVRLTDFRLIHLTFRPQKRDN